MRGATVGDQVRPQSELISIHAPLAGCDIDDLIPYANNAKFQSTHPSRGATRAIWIPHSWRKYFNPRAPCGARPRRLIRPTPRPTFQSTRPVRGATIFSPASVLLALFQSTRPVRGATVQMLQDVLANEISIHAPRAGRDCSDVARCSCQRDFNPRAPCGARPQGEQGIQGPEDFNPRAPCGARPAPTPLSSRS